MIDIDRKILVLQSKDDDYPLPIVIEYHFLSSSIKDIQFVEHPLPSYIITFDTNVENMFKDGRKIEINHPTKEELDCFPSTITSSKSRYIPPKIDISLVDEDESKYARPVSVGYLIKNKARSPALSPTLYITKSQPPVPKSHQAKNKKKLEYGRTPPPPPRMHYDFEYSSPRTSSAKNDNINICAKSQSTRFSNLSIKQSRESTSESPIAQLSDSIPTNVPALNKHFFAFRGKVRKKNVFVVFLYVLFFSQIDHRRRILYHYLL